MRKLKYFKIFGLILYTGVFCIELNSCQEKPELDNNTMIIIGNEKISLESFRSKYELDPTFPSYKIGKEGLREYADRVIDKILSEKLAEKENVLDSLPYKKLIEYEKVKAVNRSLYTKEVAEQIEVTEKELRDVFRRSGIKMKVKHLFARDKSYADELYKSLQSGVPFDTLAKELSGYNSNEAGSADLGEISWGDLDIDLEDALDNITKNEYSKPVKSKWGYHILQITERNQNLLLTEDAFILKKSSLLKKIRRRKEQIASSQYLKNYLDPFDIKIKKETFRQILNVLGTKSEKQSTKYLYRFQPLSDEDIRRLKDGLDNNLHNLFLTSNELSWTIEDFIQKVELLPVEKRPQISSAQKLKDDVGIMIRNEFLFRRAKNKGFETSTIVDSMMLNYRRELSYRYYFKKEFTKFKLPEEVAKYYQSHPNKSVARPIGILPKMKTIGDYIYYYASRKIHDKLLSKFPEIQIQINEKLMTSETVRINWIHPLRMYVVSSQ